MLSATCWTYALPLESSSQPRALLEKEIRGVLCSASLTPQSIALLDKVQLFLAAGCYCTSASSL